MVTAVRIELIGCQLRAAATSATVIRRHHGCDFQHEDVSILSWQHQLTSAPVPKPPFQPSSAISSGSSTRLTHCCFTNDPSFASPRHHHRFEPFLTSRRPNRPQVHLQLVLPPASKMFGAIRIRSSLSFAPYSCKLSIVPRITLSYCRLCMVQAKFVIIRSYFTYSSMRIRNSLSFTSSAITADVDTCFFLDWF